VGQARQRGEAERRRSHITPRSPTIWIPHPKLQQQQQHSIAYTAQFTGILELKKKRKDSKDAV
jgi:hypothetical protein